jgi:hypothetical protein
VERAPKLIDLRYGVSEGSGSEICGSVINRDVPIVLDKLGG